MDNLYYKKIKKKNWEGVKYQRTRMSEASWFFKARGQEKRRKYKNEFKKHIDVLFVKAMFLTLGCWKMKTS